MSRLKLSRTDFENHMLRPAEEVAEREFVSANNKVTVVVVHPSVNVTHCSAVWSPSCSMW